MLPISKGKPPQDLIDARRRIKSTPDATLNWNQVDSEERTATLHSLLDEQGSLCAYCMRKISNENAHVEHIKPQSSGQGADDLDSVDYGNLLAVCDGFEGNPAGLTCDRARGDTPLTVNPLKSETLESIRYRWDGTIFSKQPEIDRDLNETLNLNQPLLAAGRQAALSALARLLERRAKQHGNASVRSFCVRYASEHLADASQRQPYDGIVIYFMKRRAKAMH